VRVDGSSVGAGDGVQAAGAVYSVLGGGPPRRFVSVINVIKLN
jgi:hypothetical protein